MPEAPAQGEAAKLLSPEALDFAPDLLAIQERPPARMPRVVSLCVVALVGVLLIWAALAKLDIVASAEGRLVPQTFTKIVQPAEAGVVTDILVQDGDLVKAEQVLLRLDARSPQSDLSSLKTDLALKQLTLRAIVAEVGGKPFSQLTGDPTALYQQVSRQFDARRQAYQDSVAQETELLNKLRADLEAAQHVQQKLSTTLPTYQRSAEAYEKLNRDGFVGEIAAAEKRRDFVERQQDLRSQDASVASIQASIAQSRQRIAGLHSSYHSQLENERSSLLSELNKTGNELNKSIIRSGLFEIRAPQNGIVKDLMVTSRGAVVASGALLMNIVPMDEPLQVEVLLKNEDVGFVTVGQSVRVKIAAYPFQKYGMLDGVVSMVAADSVDPRQQTAAQPQTALTYRALVRLSKQQLQPPDGTRLELSPGMLVTAEIHQGERSVLEYLLSPLKKVGAEAARER